MNSAELLRYINLIWLLPLWSFQYALVIQVFGIKILVAVFKWSLNMGVIGLILLCIPFVGWIILAFWMLNKSGSTNQPSIQLRPSFRPWFIETWKKDAG
jgi:hypothetical protein